MHCGKLATAKRDPNETAREVPLCGELLSGQTRRIPQLCTRGDCELTFSGDPHIDSLDDAFLFMLALTTLVFSLLEALLEGKVAVVVFVPFLVTGSVYPFYLGYLRGVVERASWRQAMLRRVKGWVYLSIGTVAYAAMTATSILALRAVDLAMLAYFIVVLFGLPACYAGIRWVRLITGTALPNDGVVIGASCGAAFLFSMAAFCVQLVARLVFFPGLLQPAEVFARYAPLASLFFLAFFLIERVSTTLSEPGIDLGWQSTLVNELVYPPLEEEPRTHPHFSLGARFYAGKVLWTVRDSSICLLVGLLSQKTAVWLTILSGMLYLELYLLYPLHSRIGSLVATLASLIPLVAVWIYSKVPMHEIRATYPQSEDELLSRCKEFLDC